MSGRCTCPMPIAGTCFCYRGRPEFSSEQEEDEYMDFMERQRREAFDDAWDEAYSEPCACCEGFENGVGHDSWCQGVRR